MWKGDSYTVHLGSVKPLQMQWCFLLLRMDGFDNQPLGEHDTIILQDLGDLVFKVSFIYIIYNIIQLFPTFFISWHP